MRPRIAESEAGHPRASNVQQHAGGIRLCALVLVTLLRNSQPLEAGTTNIVDASTTYANGTTTTGTLLIGVNDPNVTLTIAPGATVTSTGIPNGDFIILGYNPAASGGRVVISGPNTVWNSSITYWSGDRSASNQTIISNGGKLISTDVSAAAGIYVGGYAYGWNDLTVTDPGSSVTASGGITIGFGTGKEGSNSIHVLNGATLSASNSLYVGYQSGYNFMVVSGSSSVSVGSLYFGVTGGYPGNNSLVVASNSTFTTGSMDIGYRGDGSTNGYGGNSVTISSGGSISSSSTTIGDNSGNNSLTVTDPGSAWINSGDADLGAFHFGYNSLIVSNGAVAGIGGNLSVGDDFDGRAVSNSVSVTGSNSSLGVGGSLYVGYTTTGNTLTVSSGASVVTGREVVIGYYTNNNSFSVTSGATLSCISNALTVGNYGQFNTLSVTEGSVFSQSAYIGAGTGASGNEVFLDTNSTWINSAGLYVGFGSNSIYNSLILSGGSSVQSGEIVLGSPKSASSNEIGLLESSIAVVATNVTIGSYGSFNSLYIRDGSRLTSSNGYISRYAGSSNNSVTVDGSNSLWGMTGDLSIGSGGSATLTLTNGGMVSAANVRILQGTLNAGVTNGLSNSSVILGSGSSTGILALQTNLTISSMTWSTNGRVSLHPGGQVLNVTGSLGIASGGGVFALVNPVLNNDTNTILTWGSNSSGFTTSSFSVYGLTGYTITTNGNALKIFMPGDAAPEISVNTTMSTNMTLSSITFSAGSSTITPTGNLTATSNVTISGGTLVNSGTITTPQLRVESGATYSMVGGTLNGNLNNGAGGTFSMDPSVINGNVNNAGLMAVPDHNIINGSLVLSHSSTLLIGGGSLLSVNGPASVGGILSIADLIPFGTRQTFLTASGGITGSFSSIQAPAGERGRLFVSGTQADILIAPASYTEVAQSANQVNVARALDSFIPSTSGDQLVVSTALDSLTASQYPQAFAQISPAFYEQIPTIAFNLANAQNNELVQRLYGLRVAGSGFSMSGIADNYAVLEGQGDGKGVLDSKKDILRPGVDNRWGMFVDGYGVFGSANSANMLPGYNFQSGGINSGLTYKWSDSVGTGIYAGYQGAYAKNNGLGTLIDNAVKFGLFGGYGTPDGKGLYLDALAGGGYHNYTANRTINFGSISRTADSSPGAGELDTMLAGGYNFRKGNWSFGPLTSLQYTYLGVNSFNETGAQSLDLNNQGWNASSMIYSLGANCAYTWQANRDVTVVPQINLSWQHEFLQNPYAINSTLQGSPTFSTWSATPNRDTLYTGIGFTVEYRQRWNTSFYYNAAAGNQNLTSENIFWSAGVKF